MKKIIGLTIAALLIIGSVGAGTLAYFSDTETSTGNSLTAGTLNLVSTVSGTAPADATKYTLTAGGDGINGNVVLTRLAPGDNGTIVWTLNNSGTLSGNVTMASSNATFTDGIAAVDPETAVSVPHANNGGSNGDIDEFVGVKLQRGVTYILGNATTYVPFSGLQAVLAAENQSIAAGGSLAYTFSWSVATDIVGLGGSTALDALVDDNIIQGDSTTIDIAFTLTQS